ncbi:MAG: family 10 glycosylhydrolase [Armatimonadota bacterium]|nr:family 10 glycosylhydrolase [Armatimonadota bacterium]
MRRVVGWLVLTIFTLLTVRVHAAPELRAFWVDTWHAALRTPAEVDAMLQAARTARANALFVEVRKRGDAYYLSHYEPLASDVASGFDPLAYLIQRAHSATPRLEVHAWLVMLPVWNSTTPPSNPAHPYNRFPQWLTLDDSGASYDGNNYSFDPGHPEAADFTYRVALDVLRHYDVDGIHFDYIRFAGSRWGYNPVSVSRFNAVYGRSGQPAYNDSAWSQWRRDQVTQLVRRIYASAVALKPWCKVTAATITWGNGPTSESAWSSTSAYSSVFQDWRAWTEEGILDIAIPMCYYNHANSTHRTYFNNWITWAKNHRYGRAVAIGLGAYLNTLSNTLTQVGLVRTPTAQGGYSDGVVFYSYAAPNVDSSGNIQWYNPSAYSAFGNYFGQWEPAPALPWKTNPTTGVVMGVALRGSNLQPLDRATVTLFRSGFSRSLFTDGNGAFAFVDVPPGVYTLRVSASGLPLVNRTVAVSAGSVWRETVLAGALGGASLSIDDLLQRPDGLTVVLSDVRVAVGNDKLGGRIYVEDGQKPVAIRINTNPAVAWIEGDRVAVLGTLTTQGGERVIVPSAVRLVGVELPSTRSLQLQVEWQQWLGDSVPVQVEILRADGTPVKQTTLTPDEAGIITLPKEDAVAPGWYDVRVKSSHWLSRRLRGVFLPSTGKASVSLVNGDVDGDNEVTLNDFGLLVRAFGTVSGDALWNPNADLDGDGEVTLFDFGILVDSFGWSGE